MTPDTRNEIRHAVTTAIYAEIPVVAVIFAALVFNAGAIGNAIANWFGAK
jgi:hypothetical protein